MDNYVLFNKNKLGFEIRKLYKMKNDKMTFIKFITIEELSKIKYQVIDNTLSIVSYKDSDNVHISSPVDQTQESRYFFIEKNLINIIHDLEKIKFYSDNITVSEFTEIIEKLRNLKRRYTF